MSNNSQKEYLKKYLSIGKDRSEKKKKKKKDKPNTIPSRLTVIDDNADTFQDAVKEDLLEDEDAPQIVAVIDERPPSLQVDEKSKTNLWIPIGSTEDSSELTLDSNKKILKNEDLSPPRFKLKLATKRNGNADISPPRKTGSSKSKSDKTAEIIKEIKIERDISPPRKRKESTPPRSIRPYDAHRNVICTKNTSKNNEEVTVKIERDASPPRKRHRSSPSRKMMKTLDGKTAGLQNAKQLAAETSILKEKETEMFNKMSSDVSGANAATIVRDKKTGRVRNFEEEAAREIEKKKKEEVNKEKYSRWGRGLKQVEDATKRREEELNEMSKPLARYANDEDLERYLKEQEREGDPMLAYIRKKKKKKDVDEGKPIKPEYMGEFMPNRFGIKPGHRWDGVDRSNGYEKKWFEIQNSKLAQQEESYKWSTEDM